MLMLLKPLAFLGAAVAYVFLKRHAHRHQAAYKITDEEYLARLALAQQCSEHDLFHEYGREWHLPTTRIEEDFKAYLRTHHLPHYVRDCIRKARQNWDPSKTPSHTPGGKLPPSWSA